MAAVSVGLFVRLEVQPGKEADVERFLRGGLQLVEGEPGRDCLVCDLPRPREVRDFRAVAPYQNLAAGRTYRARWRRR